MRVIYHQGGKIFTVSLRLLHIRPDWGEWVRIEWSERDESNWNGMVKRCGVWGEKEEVPGGKMGDEWYEELWVKYKSGPPSLCYLSQPIGLSTSFSFHFSTFPPHTALSPIPHFYFIVTLPTSVSLPTSISVPNSTLFSHPTHSLPSRCVSLPNQTKTKHLSGILDPNPFLLVVNLSYIFIHDTSPSYVSISRFILYLNSSFVFIYT